jgi:hypothetical protein
MYPSANLIGFNNICFVINSYLFACNDVRSLLDLSESSLSLGLAEYESSDLLDLWLLSRLLSCLRIFLACSIAAVFTICITFILLIIGISRGLLFLVLVCSLGLLGRL